MKLSVTAIAPSYGSGIGTNNELLASGVNCMKSGPLLLLFEEDETSIAQQLIAVGNAVDGPIQSTDHSFRKGKKSFVHDGISLTLEILPGTPVILTHQNIFTDFRPSSARSAIALALDNHVEGGQRSPAIVQSLLTAGARISRQIPTSAIFWRPAGLLSDVDFFVQTIDDYRSNGVFPILSTVNFELDEQNSSLVSSGLEWFSGQELKIVSRHQIMDRVELTKRAVRLVHDIAVNGPILRQQQVEDIESNNIIILSLNQSATLVTAEIFPNAKA